MPSPNPVMQVPRVNRAPHGLEIAGGNLDPLRLHHSQAEGGFYALYLRSVEAGLLANALPVRVGRSSSSPPQLGQRSSSASAQAAQNVHSNEQMNAPGSAGGKSVPQRSQSGRISSIAKPYRLTAADASDAFADEGSCLCNAIAKYNTGFGHMEPNKTTDPKPLAGQRTKYYSSLTDALSGMTLDGVLGIGVQRRRSIRSSRHPPRKAFSHERSNA